MTKKGLTYLFILGVILFGTWARSFAEVPASLEIAPKSPMQEFACYTSAKDPAYTLYIKFTNQFSFEQGSHLLIEEQLEEETEEEIGGQAHQHFVDFISPSFQTTFQIAYLQENPSKQQFNADDFPIPHISRCILFRVFRI